MNLSFKIYAHTICIIYRNENSQLSSAIVLFLLPPPQQSTRPVAQEGIKSCTKMEMGLSEKRASGDRFLFVYLVMEV